MSRLLLLTSAPGASAQVLPALGLLTHQVRVLPPQPQALLEPTDCDLILLDATRELAAARGLSRVLRVGGLSVPLLAVFTEGGLAAISAEWQIDDFVLVDTGPTELQARLTLALSGASSPPDIPSTITAGEVVIDEQAYSARLRGRSLDLTYKEFELLKYLAQHPGRVFTRAQLLQEVWGSDYFGGTRTVDVHVRRLRAKLGADRESLIGTVRNVGYHFTAGPTGAAAAVESHRGTGAEEDFQTSHHAAARLP